MTAFIHSTVNPVVVSELLDCVPSIGPLLDSVPMQDRVSGPIQEKVSALSLQVFKLLSFKWVDKFCFQLKFLDCVSRVGFLNSVNRIQFTYVCF